MTKNRFDDMFAEADEAFDSKYQKEMNELKGFSDEELAVLTPDTTSKDVYLALIKLVSQASKENLAQANLIDRIKEMGGIAINIAKKIPSFAKFL